HLPDGGSLPNLRKQEYEAMLSGAAGQLYGSAFTWQFPAGWQDKLDSPGVRELTYMQDFFASRRWYDLIPDQRHTAVVRGYGEFSSEGSISSDTYAAAARMSDGTSVIAYIPSSRTVTVDMANLAKPAIARWYDPTNGTYQKIDSSPLANSGFREFSTPGANSARSNDWVLTLDVIQESETN